MWGFVVKTKDVMGNASLIGDLDHLAQLIKESRLFGSLFGTTLASLDQSNLVMF